MNSPFGESIPLTHNTLIIILYFFLFLNVFAFRLKKNSLFCWKVRKNIVPLQRLEPSSLFMSLDSNL